MAKAIKNKTIMNVDEEIINKIHYVKGHKVMLDYDLAQLYEVETKALNQAVKRNSLRFPEDFMFQLTREEYNFLRSQNVTLENSGKGRYSKYNPKAFTEQGVAMLSGILTSEKAIAMNIAIMRAFVQVRQFIFYQNNITKQIELLKERLGEHDAQLNGIYEAIENLLDDKVKSKHGKTGKELDLNQTHKLSNSFYTF